MSRRRRALLLGGLALVLGGLAASNVAGREAALQRRVGGLVHVVVAQDHIAAGSVIRRSDLAVRRVPARFAPAGAIASPGALAGQRAAVDVAAGSDLTVAVLESESALPAGPPIRRGERVAELVALGSAALVVPGGRVDVLVTPEPSPGAGGEAVLALQDVEVLDVTAVAAEDSPPRGGDAAPGERVAVSLRVTLRQAVYLAAAQDFARELRLLPRAAGDRSRVRAGLSLVGPAP